MWMPGLPFLERRIGMNIYRIPCIRFSESIRRAWEMPLYLVFALLVLCYLCMRRKYALNHTHSIFPDGVLAS